MLPTDAIIPTRADEFHAAVRWLQAHGSPELTPADAVAQAVEDWITLVRIEHLPSKSTAAAAKYGHLSIDRLRQNVVSDAGRMRPRHKKVSRRRY